MKTLEDRRQELTYALEHAPASLPRLHPNLAQIYHDKVARLTAALNEDRNWAEAAEVIRAFIEEIRLVPNDGNLRIELSGALKLRRKIFQVSRPDHSVYTHQITLPW